MSLDFVKMAYKLKSNKTATVEPDFVVNRCRDIMIKGRNFYSVWNETTGLWSTDENTVTDLVDAETQKYYREHYGSVTGVSCLLMSSSLSGVKDRFVKYCRNQMPDWFVPLNQKVIFSDATTTKEDYASFKLPYSMSSGSTNSWDEIMEVLYSDEREKLEWMIGAVVAGDTSKIQKAFVLYGDPGSGKSTVLNIIADMFKGYTCTFSAKALGSSKDDYALEPFKTFPLIAIEHDADLSKIESNARLNSLVSHEPLSVNEKFKSLYSSSFNTFLMIGTNNPVRITDSKSGLLRRLIDITPTGNKIPFNRYSKLLESVKFEYGAIAKKCLEFYVENKHEYDNYIPTLMFGETNDTFNFFEEKAFDYSKLDYVLLKRLWEEYNRYCDESNVIYKLTKKIFKTEAKSYFKEFYERKKIDGHNEANVYEGFRSDKFFTYLNFEEELEHDDSDDNNSNDNTHLDSSWLDFKEVASGDNSKLDEVLSDKPAQLAIVDGEYAGAPSMKWDNVRTKLKDIDPHELHYVRVEPNHIVLDFDIKGDDGEKSLEKNLAAASKFPPTYAELSKSGSGIHLHYIYTGGDPDKLSRLYDNNVEIKVFTGKSSLRRKLTKCNDLDIASINSGLPFKEEKKKVINEEGLKNEKALRTLIRKNLNKEYHSNTASSIDFIASELEKAYNAGMSYDVTDLRPSIMAFAAQSTNQSERCLKVVAKMKFKSEDVDDSSVGIGERLAEAEYGVNGDSGARLGDGTGTGQGTGVDLDESDFIFFDVEVFPNLFVVVWKKRGPENQCVTWINPSGSQIEELSRHKLIGFNNRGYDNHILYGRMLGYSEHDLYILSQRLVSNESKNATFRDAYNLSYTDIYDFASAGNKMSLKKWEIKLGIHHLELGLPWDKPVPKDMWDKVAEYCVNDVVSTEAVFDALASDYMARVILADLAEGTPNDTTNQLTTKLIFGNTSAPQGEFQYRDLSKPVNYVSNEIMDYFKEYCPNMVKTRFDEKSILPYFDGYSYEYGKSVYKGVDVGEGGYVYAEPGIYYNVALIDVTSMHPHSIISECLFGPRFTKRFFELVYGRVYIKHEDWDYINSIFDGKLSPFVDMVKTGVLTSDQLATALKTAINSVYGLTAAKFKNKFKDERNIDNIVAKRGALFMVDLKEAVQAKGFTVAHIKTDSIKIPNATREIIEFVMDFAEKYGYHFEHEATYSEMCLINDAVYIAKYATADKCMMELYGYVPKDNKKQAKEGHWTATGARFAEPYVFKSLFSHEEIDFKDLCVTKSVKTFMALDMNESLSDGEHDYRFIGRVGNFCPVIQGSGGGELYRVSEKKTVGEDGRETVKPKYDAVAGTKGYRWLESEVVKNVGGAGIIDKSYFRAMVDDAKAEIEKFGDFDIFVDDGDMPF